MKNIKGHHIFLLDAMGALVSTGFLFLLYSLDDFFGMPKQVIKIFICIATTLYLYSITTYFVKPIHWRLYLKIIVFLNLAYSLFTSFKMFQHLDTLTIYGYIYFIGEIIVILLLSGFELKNARGILFDPPSN